MGIERRNVASAALLVFAVFFGVTLRALAQAKQPDPSSSSQLASICSSGSVEEGCGTFTWPDGSRYVGQFHAGLFYGQGVLTFSDGSRLEGDFENGGPDGEATFTFPNGTKLTGRYHGILTDPRYPHPPLHFPFWRALFGGEGSVRVIVTVDRNGTVMSANILNASKYPSFNSAALNGLRAWRFLPARISDTPIEGAHVVEVQFASAVL